MSMHKIPLTPLEEEGLRNHGLDIGTPSQLSDVFRHGMAWAQQARQGEAVACWLKSSKPGEDMVVLGNPADIHQAATDVKIALYAGPPAMGANVPRELLKEAADELEFQDEQRLREDKVGLRSTPPRVARLLSKLLALLAQGDKP